jgi:hypothetical protein
MEEWRAELEAAIERGLPDSRDDDSEVEQEAFLDAFDEWVGDSDAGPRRPRWGGSRVGRQYVHRDREVGHDCLFHDYFSDDPTYDFVKFRRRFRMRRELFLSIVDRVCAYDQWFVQRPDAAGRMGLSSLQKCTAAVRMLAYGVAADATDEYIRLGASTSDEALRHFCIAIRGCFESTFLRQPSREDLEKQISINTIRGFPGMFTSIDCMHWTWKNCPVAWQGQFQDKDGLQSVILEAVADQSLWIWHAFFGMPGGNNDINVLDRSPLISNFLRGEGSDMQFIVNGNVYNRYYLLADGIYPQWSCFVQPISAPQGEKREHFTKVQSALRKDVERAFGVLQARWEIVRNPVRAWGLETISDIMMACIILHNMVVQDERNGDFESIFDFPMRGGSMRRGVPFEELRAGVRDVESVATHFKLRNDLIDHLWALKGSA